MLAGPVTDLVFDLAGLKFISSAGLRVFGNARKSLKERGGQASFVQHAAPDPGSLRDRQGPSGRRDLQGHRRRWTATSPRASGGIPKANRRTSGGSRARRRARVTQGFQPGELVREAPVNGQVPALRTSGLPHTPRGTHLPSTPRAARIRARLRIDCGGGSGGRCYPPWPDPGGRTAGGGGTPGTPAPRTAFPWTTRTRTGPRRASRPRASPRLRYAAKDGGPGYPFRNG